MFKKMNIGKEESLEGFLLSQRKVKKEKKKGRCIDCGKIWDLFRERYMIQTANKLKYFAIKPLIVLYL